MIKCTPPAIKDLIVELSKQGKNVSEIAKCTNKPWSTCKKILQKYWETESTNNRWNNVRQVKWTVRDSRTLARIIKKDPSVSTKAIFAEFLKENPKSFHRATLYKKLKELGYSRRALRKGVIIRNQNLIKRRKWAKSRPRWTAEDWLSHIFSDETSVQIGGNKKIYVWRKVDEKDRPHLVPKKARSGVIKVMMWGCITSKGRVILLPVNGSITSETYCQVLQDGLLPVIDCYYPDGNFIFVQDNAPCHSLSETRNWLDDRQIRMSQWPPQSPDINIIENIWRWVKMELRKHIKKIKSRQDLVDALQDIWRKLEDEKIQELYASFPKRIKAVIKSKGTMTKY